MRRDPHSITEVVADVRRICIAIQSTENFKNLFNYAIVRKAYLVNHCEKRKVKAGSVKKYLYSIIKFCTFLLTENVELYDVTIDDILKMKLRLGLWRERYSVEDKGLSFVREAEDYQMLVTPEQVHSYERSDHAMLAKELFQQLKGDVRSNFYHIFFLSNLKVFFLTITKI